NVSLIHHGLLGASPTQPTVSFTLESLEFYHQLCHHQANFSIQAFIKVLCAIHNSTYTHTLRMQFSVTFDVYLDILWRVQALVNAAWEHGQGWRIQNACLPCGFKVPGELELVPDRLHAMDGNNFMKQVDGSGNCDEHVFSSDYLIPPSIVDNFKDDVATHPGTQAQLPQALPFGDEKTWCTDNWTVANTVSKGTAQVFQQTGGFISACRHTIIETFIEMWQSGELAKYGLATINKLLNVFGANQGVKYDIGGSHKVTIAASSISEKA
ncbi:hypothetical protein L208DRAFT_1288390, partial [Tricholoma matsutake]